MNATQSSTSKDVLVVDEQRRFGQWRKKHVDYFDDGNLAKVEHNATLLDGSANRYVRFANYHRGQPLNIYIPARYTAGELSASREVDNNGWVTSFTDFVSNRTEYKYDDAGRISAVAPKNGIEAGTLFSWSNSGSPVRTESRCMLNSANTACATSSALLQTVTHYDSMLRPTKVSTTDIANNYTINQSFRHDYPHATVNHPPQAPHRQLLNHTKPTTARS